MVIDLAAPTNDAQHTDARHARSAWLLAAWQVRGDFDDPIYLPGIVDSLPESKVVSVGAFKLGVCHGHQIVPWGDAESLGALDQPARLECRSQTTTVGVGCQAWVPCLHCAARAVPRRCDAEAARL